MADGDYLLFFFLMLILPCICPIFFIFVLCIMLIFAKDFKVTIQDRMVIQSALVISKSKGPSETLRDIRTSTYQICRLPIELPNFPNGPVI